MTIERLRRYQAIVNSGKGLLAREWDHFDSLERQLDPAAYKERQENGAKNVAMGYARKLSIEDLEAIINEKRYEEKARKMRECDERD